MAKKKLKDPKPWERKYYGPSYNSRADNRNPTKTYTDGAPAAAQTGVYKRGKAKPVLRGDWLYGNPASHPRRS